MARSFGTAALAVATLPLAVAGAPAVVAGAVGCGVGNGLTSGIVSLAWVFFCSARGG